MFTNITEFFDFFRSKGIPDEIICKILYEFKGVQHPLVSLLLDKTNVYKVFSEMPYIDELVKNYKDFGNSMILTNKFINEQKNHSNKYNTDAIIYRDFGCILPRPFGKLYNDLNENNLVEEGMKMEYWKLDRSKQILDKMYFSTSYRYSLYNYPEILKHKILSTHNSSINESTLKNIIRVQYKSWTNVLKFYEI